FDPHHCKFAISWLHQPRIKISARQRWRTLATTMVVDLMGCYAPRRSDNQLAI
ncbi:Os10g0105966, partial [Oryza sativa Japonica Group]